MITFLMSYIVDGEAGRITLCTKYPHDDPPTRTDVVFTGVVVDHYFRHVVLPSIIFDIEPVPVRTMIERNKQIIDSGHRLSGWPSFWRETVDAMVDELSRNNTKMFEISSSFGLDGWVAAGDCELVESAIGLCD